MTLLKFNRITIIGMSGVGKSSFGKALSKKYNIPFIDTDDVLKNLIKQPLSDYLLQHGESAFLKLEQSLTKHLILKPSMILATGGSVIYLRELMNYFKTKSTIIYFKDTLENINNRVDLFKHRAIIMNNHSNMKAVYNERLNLYKKWADITIDFPNKFSFNYTLKHIETYLT